MLNEKHRKAISYHLQGMSQRDALRKAGYAESLAVTKPGLVFHRKDVQAELRKRRFELSKATNITAEWILSKLKAIVEAEVTDLLVEKEDGVKIDISMLSPNLRTAITGIGIGRGGIKIKAADKLRALELLMRHLGLFQDKVVVEGEIDLVTRLQAGRARISKNEV